MKNKSFNLERNKKCDDEFENNAQRWCRTSQNQFRFSSKHDQIKLKESNENLYRAFSWIRKKNDLRDVENKTSNWQTNELRNRFREKKWMCFRCYSTQFILIFDVKTRSNFDATRSFVFHEFHSQYQSFELKIFHFDDSRRAQRLMTLRTYADR